MKLHAEIWELKTNTTVFIDNEDTGETVAIVNDEINGDGKHPLTHEEAVKLGHVIAAAPELLEALCAALPFVEDMLDDKTVKVGYIASRINLIRAAIAKAEGRGS